MPLIEECPFFGINYNNIGEPFLSSGYSTDIENAVERLQSALSPGFSNTIGTRLQDCIDSAARSCESLDQYGSHTCTINTNFDSVKKAQYYSFVAFLRNKFDRYKQLCNYQIDNRYNQSCKKIELKYEFSFLNNIFEFTVSEVTDLLEGLIDSEKIEEVFDVATFSGTINYIFYVKPEVITQLPESLTDKINYLFDKVHEIADKTEE